MTYQQLRDIMNSLPASRLQDDVEIQEIAKIINPQPPKAAAVGNQPTTGFSGLFNGTSWGSK
jgi:hypothetical protein